MSPDKFKQTKITAFCSAAGMSQENVNLRMNRKRKNTADIIEVHKTPSKRAAKPESKSPDLFYKSPEKNFGECLNIKNETKSDFEHFSLDDFENDPFLSPIKKESPKKNVLTENFSSNETWADEKSEINFETPTKCKILKTTFKREKHFEQILLLSDLKSNKIGVCLLRDVWTSSSFSLNDVVSIQANYSEGHWVVDNKNGFVILHPDVIISSTALTQAMFCMRQGLLANFFKEMDSGGNGKMLVGRLVHELFQESLKGNIESEKNLHEIIDNSLQSRGNLAELFFSDKSLSDIQKEMKSFIPQVKKFLDVYINKVAAPTGKNYNGAIDEVIDIEELIKSPTLGFQGRIDVTVALKSKKAKKMAPLELKTGKATFSKEHRSQLILYILLMNELGRKVDSGLLLYLREGILEEVFPQRDEVRNLFLLRNHFVEFFKSFSAGNLPEPIRNIKCCEMCSCSRVCTTYLKSGDWDKLSPSHPLKGLEIPDVKPSHVDYFLKWNKMLCLEHAEIFEEKPEDCEISQLTLEPNVESYKGEFKCNFRRNDKSKSRSVRCGTYVHVMDGKNYRICSGQVTEVTDSQISVITDKKPQDLNDIFKLIVFKSKFLYIYLSNLGWLLNKEFECLRELIIDKKVPEFEKSFDKTNFREKCLKHLLNLNKGQQKAILKSLLCQNYLLIKGPPGTGKTQTIVALIKILLALDKTVLVASHTNSSVDNILLKLNGVEYLRLGSLKSIHKDIHKNSYNFLIESCSSVNDVQKLFDRKLIASTCMGIDTNIIRKVKFEYCIIDESSQVLQLEILRPLFCSKKYILLGDDDQLPPIVRNPEAKKLGMDTSMFEWLSNDQVTVWLKLQYRMNSVINALANAITYKGLIECGNEEVANATMEIPNRQLYLQENEWIVHVLSNELEKSVVFVDTSEYFLLNNTDFQNSRSSTIEANIIQKLVSCLIKFGLKEENMGVIAPFWDQITLLTKTLAKENVQGIEINTVDQYQGRDKEVILFSCTKENQADNKATETEILNDERRLTVAITRAKYKLIILGDKNTIVKYKPFQKLINSLNESQIFRLSNGEKNFFWEKLLN